MVTGENRKLKMSHVIESSFPIRELLADIKYQRVFFTRTGDPGTDSGFDFPRVSEF